MLLLWFNRKQLYGTTAKRKLLLKKKKKKTNCDAVMFHCNLEGLWRHRKNKCSKIHKGVKGKAAATCNRGVWDLEDLFFSKRTTTPEHKTPQLHTNALWKTMSTPQCNIFVATIKVYRKLLPTNAAPFFQAVCINSSCAEKQTNDKIIFERCKVLNCCLFIVFAKSLTVSQKITERDFNVQVNKADTVLST